MINPGYRIINAFNIWHGRQGRASKQDHVDAKRACGGNFAVGRRSAAIFGDNHINIIPRHQCMIVRFNERAAAENVVRIRNGKRRLDRIDTAHEIMMLRSRLKGRDLLAPESQKYPAWCGPERLNRLRHTFDFGPAITGNARPGGAAQGQQCGRQVAHGMRCISGNHGGVGMGRINQNIDALLSDISGKTGGSTKAADAERHIMWGRRDGPACERQCDRNIPADREAIGEFAGFGRAAEYKDAWHVAG